MITNVRLYIIVLLSLLTINATAATRQWNLQVSENQRYLQYTDGTPFFWLGDTGWLLPVCLDRGGAKGYLTECGKKGFNVVQIQVLSGVPSINWYGQMSNISKTNPWDFTNIDREGVYGYWDHMDYIIEEAERQGIYIGMVPIWGGLVKAGLLDIDGAKAYGKFLAKRYGNKPNIIWIIGGDIQGDIKPEIWETLATAIKSLDKRHLMTYHPRGRYTSAKWWSKADWIDFHMYQSGHRAYGQRMGNKDYPIPDNTEEDCWMYIDSTWAYKPIKPVVDGEPSYEDIPIGLHFADGPRWKANDVRRYAYWNVFAGAFGHTYGHNAIMQMHTPGKAVAYANTCKNWWEAQNDSGYVSMQYLKALMLAMPFFERIPDQSIIYKNNGTQYNRLIATRGKDYILVYDYTGRDMDIDLSKISGTTKNVWWMDAATGDLQYLGEHKGKKNFKALHLSSTDGVLIAIDSAKEYLAKEQKNILKPITKEKKDLTE
ncbi:MAG: glycoside hydrolase family 140 protein [Prevotella sp.]|nr:glycoside hydrolase family 140 protein [Candidatus Prevotella equi]